MHMAVCTIYNIWLSPYMEHVFLHNNARNNRLDTLWHMNSYKLQTRLREYLQGIPSYTLSHICLAGCTAHLLGWYKELSNSETIWDIFMLFNKFIDNTCVHHLINNQAALCENGYVVIIDMHTP